jgi:hypothetical protein
MKSAPWILFPALALALASPAAGQVPADLKQWSVELKPTAKPDVPPGPEEIARAWSAFAAPGEPHTRLAKLAGKWATKTKSWTEPGKPPEETTGSCEFRMVLGGRYLEQRFEGSMMGQPFSGIGYTGYDNVKKKYEAFWIDTAGTGMLVLSGSQDKSGKKTVYTGSMIDPASGKPVAIRSVDTKVDADNLLFEMWTSGPDGKMSKSMEMSYTRKK